MFVSDHFQPWKHTDGHAPSALVWLGALGASTQRIVMGTSVLTPTFRYHPSVVAQVFGTLGSLFPGRVILGVGTGEGLNEVPSTGMVWPEMKERFGRLREAISLIRKLWAEDNLTFEGEYYKTQRSHDLRQAGPAVADLCRRRGAPGGEVRRTDGGRLHLHQRQEVGPVHRDAAAERGRGLALSAKPKPDYDRMIEMKVSFDTDKQRAMEDTRIWAALALTPEEKMTVHDPKEMERLADALPVERAASRWIVSSDPDEHIEKIKPYIDMGFRHLVFHAPGNDQARFLKLYGEMVLPKLRAALRVSMTSRLELFALPGLPMVRAGDDLPAMILAGLDRERGRLAATAMWWWSRRRSCPRPKAGTVDLADVVPSAQAVALAAEVGKDPRIVEVVLSESVRGGAQPAEPDDHAAPPGVRDGQCGGRPVERGGGGWTHQRALLLPLDPDGSAEAIRARLAGRRKSAW